MALEGASLIGSFPFSVFGVKKKKKKERRKKFSVSFEKLMKVLSSTAKGESFGLMQ